MSTGGKDGVLDGSDRPCGTARRLVGRVDRIAAEVAVVTRELAQLKAAVKVILESRPEPGGESAAAEAPRKGQPEWLECRDPELAETILVGLEEWVRLYGQPLGVAVFPCWAWHPQVVVLLLAAAEHHAAVYQGKVPRDVTDFLSRVLPVIAKQALKVQDHAECNDYAHREPADPTPYTAHVDLLPDLAEWWATNRQGRPPGLTPRLEAAVR